MNLRTFASRFPDRVEHALRALAALSFRRWPLVLTLTALLTALSAVLAARLKLETDLGKLLPRSHQSVRDTEQLAERFGGSGYVVVQLSGAPEADLARFADQLAPRLEQLPTVSYVEHKRSTAFFEEHALYYLDLPDLRELRDRLSARRAWEVSHRLGIDLLDEPPPRVDLSDIEQKYRQRFDLHGEKAGDGRYYDAAHGRLSLFVKPNKLASDLAFSRRVVGDVRQAIAGADRAGFPAGLRADLTGRYTKRVELQALISHDLTITSLVSLALVAAYVAWHFRRVTAVALVLVPLGVSLSLTYGFAALAVGSVNILTAFIGAILLGLGVDGGVHLLGRYDEERAAGCSPAEAVARTFGESGRASAAAALTNAGAFACLMLAEFKAFREFGALAAAGVVSTLICYAVVLPAMLGAAVRLGRRGAPQASEVMPGASLVVRRAPWVFLGLGALMATALTALPRLRFNYDFGALDSADLPSYRLAEEMRGVLGRSQSPLVVLTDSPAEARAAAEAIRARSRQRGAASTIGRVATMTDLVPEGQAEKAAVIGEIGAIVRRIDPSRLPDDERRRLERARAMTTAGPFTRDDLPEAVTRQSRDSRGERVTDFVLVYPSVSMSDGRYAQQIADEVRDLSIGGGRSISAAGEPMVLADVLGGILRDLPRLVVLALAQQIVLLSLFLGGLRRAMVTLSPAFLSIPLAGALMPVFGLELNYLNVILIPVLIGMGEDGVAHLITRLASGDELEPALGQTGRATVGSAITTAAGFGTLALAGHPGLRSVGEAALIAIGANLLVSIAFLPAALALLGARAGVANPAE